MRDTGLKIRIAESNDLERVVEILNESIKKKFITGFLNPLNVNDRKEWFNQHSVNENPLYVAVHNNAIAGWLSVSSYRTGRLAFRFTKEISYYVSEKHQRMGIASDLIQFAISSARKLNVKTYLAMVQERNIPGISLLEKNHFTKWGFLPQIGNFDGEETGLIYYGLRITGNHQ